MNKYGLIAALATAILTLIGGGWVAVTQSKPGQVESCFTRISQLELDKERLLRENIGMIVQLAERTNTQEVLEVVLDGIHHPVWAKERVTLNEPNEFGHMVEYRMLYVNKAYQEVFGISNSQYKGKTDFEAGWTKSEHLVFHANDEVAYKSGSIRTTETFRGRVLDLLSELVTWKIDKNAATFPSGKEVVIGLAYRFDV